MAGHHRQPVLARQAGDADVGDEHPLGGLLDIVAALRLDRVGHHQVEAGLALAHDLADRHQGVARPVALGRRQVHLARPDAAAGLLGDLVNLRLAQRIGEAVARHLLDQRAVVDAQELEADAGRVDRRQRHAAAAFLGQDIGRPAEGDRRLAVAHDRAHLLALLQPVAGLGRQALADGQHIDLPMGDAVDAQIVAAAGHVAADRGLGPHIVIEGEALGLGQLVVEAHADPRLLALGRDVHADDTEGDDPLQLVAPLYRRLDGASAMAASKTASASRWRVARSNWRATI